MYIPNSIKVRVRHDNSYNNSTVKKADKIPLGYITYVDDKGKLRKEKSWSEWGDEYIGEFGNTPMRGYRLENMVTRSRDYFGSGRSMYRVVNPNGFAFEITTDNFFEICMDTNIQKGVIDDDCVLAWDGANLALINLTSDIYKEYAQVTNLVDSGHIKISDLVAGKPYQNKAGDYIGYYIGKVPVISSKSKYVSDYVSYLDNKSHHEYTIRFKYAHLFARTDVYGTLITSPQVYECMKPDTKLDISTINMDKIEKSLYNDHIVPEHMRNGKSSIDNLKTYAETYMRHKLRKECFATNRDKYNFMWETFPKAI
jgi:hypothetical protein